MNRVIYAERNGPMGAFNTSWMTGPMRQAHIAGVLTEQGVESKTTKAEELHDKAQTTRDVGAEALRAA